MADDHPYPSVLIQVGKSPSSRRRSISVSSTLIFEMSQVHATGGDVTELLQLGGFIEPDEYVLQWGPGRDGQHVSVASPYPGPFALAEDAQPTTLQELERRVAELEAKPDLHRIAGRLRQLARDELPTESLSLKCALFAIANELDGGPPDVRRPGDWTAMRKRMEANPADSEGPWCRSTSSEMNK